MLSPAKALRAKDLKICAMSFHLSIQPCYHFQIRSETSASLLQLEGFLLPAAREAASEDLLRLKSSKVRIRIHFKQFQFISMKLRGTARHSMSIMLDTSLK